MDPLLWTETILSEPSFLGGTVTVTEGGGTLRIIPDTANYNGYVSVPTYDLTDASISVKALRGSDDAASYIALVAGLDDDNFFRICAVGDQLQIDSRILGFYTEHVLDASFTVDLGLWQWWRIRGELGHLHAETSPDGLVWTTRFEWTAPFTYTAVKAALEGGQWSGAGPDAEVQFDNFALDVTGTEPEGIEITGGSFVTTFDPPITADWAKFSVPAGQVGVTYEGESIEGLAKTYGVGWYALLTEREVSGGGAIQGTTEPRFITNQSLLDVFAEQLTIVALITNTRVGVNYSVTFGNDAT